MLESYTHNQGYQAESQYVFHSHRFNMQLGGGLYSTDSYNDSSFYGVTLEQGDTRPQQQFGYLYTHTTLIDHVIGTLGVAYDRYDDMASGSPLRVSQLSPKLGLKWNPVPWLTLRAAGFQGVKSSVMNNQLLQPSQIAGFNQFYDDINGSRATQYGVGFDVKPSDTLFGGFEVYQRGVKTPNSASSAINERRETLYRIYTHWLPEMHWAVNSELRYEEFYGPEIESVKALQTAYLLLKYPLFCRWWFFLPMWAGNLCISAL